MDKNIFNFLIKKLYCDIKNNMLLYVQTSIFFSCCKHCTLYLAYSKGCWKCRPGWQSITGLTQEWTAILAHIYTCGQFRVPRWSNVFGRKPEHPEITMQSQGEHANSTQNVSSSPADSNSQTLLCTTVLPVYLSVFYCLKGKSIKMQCCFVYKKWHNVNGKDDLIDIHNYMCNC